MSSLAACVALALLLTSCSTPQSAQPVNEPGPCEDLTGVFVTVRERVMSGEDEGGPARTTLIFEDDRAVLNNADTVEEGIVDCIGDDVLLRYSEIHASQGEPMASGWVISTPAGPVLWLRNEAFVPRSALVGNEVPPTLAVTEARGRVVSVQRSAGYSFAADDGWRMGPATITLADGSVVDVPAGTQVNGGCLDPDVPDFRDSDCWLHAFIDGTGTVARLWSGEILDGVVRFFPPGRIGDGPRIGGVAFRFDAAFAPQEPCDVIAADSPGEALRRAMTTSREVELLLDPESGTLLGIVCHLDD